MPQERPKGKEMEVVLIVVVTVHFVDATPKATKKKTVFECPFQPSMIASTMKLLQMGHCTDLMDITYTEDNIKASVTIDLAS